MRLIGPAEPTPGGGILTMGTFDGVHRGHQALLAAARAWAQKHRTYVEVWVFDPHPRTILRGEQVPLLTTLSERVALLEEVGVDVVRTVPFTRELAALPTETFVQEWIIRLSRPQGMVLGYDHRFGQGRKGSAELVCQMGIPVKEVPPLIEGEGPISSSRIRKLLEQGHMEAAEELLGRPFGLMATVRRGQGLARRWGVPTANLPWPEEKLRPPAGTYAGWAYREGAYPAVLYLPPKGDLEVHLLDLEQDLYEKPLQASFLAFLRPYADFPDEVALHRQILEDVQLVRRYFAESGR